MHVLNCTRTYTRTRIKKRKEKKTDTYYFVIYEQGTSIFHEYVIT